MPKCVLKLHKIFQIFDQLSYKSFQSKNESPYSSFIHHDIINSWVSWLLCYPEVLGSRVETGSENP